MKGLAIGGNSPSPSPTGGEANVDAEAYSHKVLRQLGLIEKWPGSPL